MKQTLGPFKKFRVTRAEGVVINRFWIGHTWATKFHILSQGHHNSTSCTSSHSSRTASPVNHKNSYINHVNIYSFSDVLYPQCALGATLYQCYVHLAAQCIIHSHWASGDTILQHPVHLAIPGVLGPQWAIGATIWTMSRSSHFRMFCVPNEPWEPLYVSPVSPGNHHIYRYFVHQTIQGVLGPQWAIGTTIWDTPWSIHFQTFSFDNEPWEPLHINVMYM